MKRYLVTGGAGFIGSNFIAYYLSRNRVDRIVNLDKLTYAGDPANVAGCSRDPRYTFIRGDIADRALVERVFRDEGVTDVVHFAAESHVDQSIETPGLFVETNAVGTSVLLDEARRRWMLAPNRMRPGCESNRFHHVSTDEVYGSLGAAGTFLETSAYAPNSPYAASKAAADLFVRACFRTYGMNVTGTNCSNNYGPNQHAEKLIPKIVLCCAREEPIPIYGDGRNVRDWIYVLDHCRAIERVFLDAAPGQRYNVGGHAARTNRAIAEAVCDVMDRLRPGKKGRYADLITYVPDRAGHDLRYAVDTTKIERELGWRPETPLEQGLAKTVEWLLERYGGTGERER